MPNTICVDRVKASKSRKLPYLPRLGFVLDIGHRRFTFRTAPLLETLINLVDKGFSLDNFSEVGNKQLAEITLPKHLNTTKKLDSMIAKAKDVTC